MSKKDFLQRLSQGLDLLDEVEKREILGFYEERFHSGMVYEGKTEEEVVADLESPETIARNVLEEYGINPKYIKTKEQRYNNVDSTQIVGVALFDVFVASWLLPAIVSITFALFASLISYVGVIPLIIGEHTIADEYLFAFLTAAYVLLFFIALAILELSLGIIRRITVWHLNVFKLKDREKWIKKLSKISIDRIFKSSGTVKFLKGILIIGSIVTIGFTGYRLFVGEDQYFASYTNVQEQTDEYNFDVSDTSNWSIVTNLNSIDVQIKLVDREDVHVVHSYTDKQDFEISVNEETNQILIEQEIERIARITTFRDIIGWFVSGSTVVIEVPESMTFDQVDVSVLNGNIDIDNLVVNDLTVGVLNGSITIDQLVLTEDTVLETTNGNVYVYDTVSENDLSVSTINGSISLSNVEFNDYTLNLENGKIKLKNLNVDLQDGSMLNATTTNGAIELDNVYVANVVLTTTNGSIEYNNDDTSYILNSLDTETTNGSYQGNVRD